MRYIRISLLIVATAAVTAVATGALMQARRAGGDAGGLTPGGTPVRDFALLDQNGRFHQLYRLRQTKAVVLYTHGIGCPLVRASLPALKGLRDRYAKRGVEFLLIDANPQDDRHELEKDAALHGIDMPILQDDSQLVAEQLGVLRTGEALLLDPAGWTIRYRGPIDDRAQQGSQKPTRRYLQDAIEAVLDGERIAIAAVPGTGCLISSRDAGGELGPVSPVSYEHSVVPILQQKCVPCHSPGGIGPWSMDSYERVKGWSAMMREVIMNKRMPPWHADPGIGKFTPDRSLSIDEQRTLVRWIDQGAPRGEQQDPLVKAPARGTPEWPLGTPDRVIDIPEQQIPAQGNLAYRWLKIPLPIDQDTWVRAVHLKPSNLAVMHHGFVFVQYPGALKAQQPDWLEGVNGFFAAYVPGAEVLPFPEDSGQLLPLGATLVLQLHYVPIGRPTGDRPKLGLYFHTKPPALEYRVASASNMKIRIPPHAPNHEEHAEAVLGEGATLHALYPHMHYRGRRFQYRVQYADGSSEPLLSVPNYDSGWQTVYYLAAPKHLPPGARIAVNASFDNSDQNPLNPDPSKEVKWGLTNLDEMLVGYFMYTRERPLADASSTARSAARIAQTSPHPDPAAR